MTIRSLRVAPRIHSIVDKIIENRSEKSGLTYSQVYENLMKHGMVIDQYKPKFKSQNYKESDITNASEKLKSIVRCTQLAFGDLTSPRTIHITPDTYRMISDYSDTYNVTHNRAAYRYSILGTVYRAVLSSSIGILSKNPAFSKICASQPFYNEIVQNSDLYTLIFNDIAKNVDPVDNVWGDVISGRLGKFELKSEDPSVQTTETPKPVPKKRLTLRGGSIP